MTTPQTGHPTGSGGAVRVFDHHELERTLVAVAATLRNIHAEGALTPTTARIGRSALRRLEADLGKHFAYETGSGGFFAEVLEAAPAISKRLEFLADEHVPLAAQFGRVVEAAQRAGTSPAEWSHVVERFEAFTVRLRRHEHAEDGVVADALMYEEGGSG